MNAVSDQTSLNVKELDLETKKEYDYYIAVKTNSYLPWITIICVVAETFYMFTDYYIRHNPDRIYARIPPVVLGGVVFWLWRSKLHPLKLLFVRRIWDISIFITAYWLCILSYRTPVFITSLGSIPFLAFAITFLACYSTRYLVLLFSITFLLFIGIIIAKYGVQKDLFDVNASILFMTLSLVLNQWRNKLYFSEFSLKRQLEATINKLASTQDRLIYTEKMAALGELTSGIAHEIQNPLNFVINFSEMSASVLDELGAELKKPTRDLAYEALLYTDLKANLFKIVSHGKRISAIVKGMLEHSRIKASHSDPIPTNLNNFVNECLSIAFHNAKIKNKALKAELITKYDASLPPVEIIQQEMSRVLLNLFDNAFYAVWEKQNQQNDAYIPAVTISTSVNNKYVEVRVSDNGTGIPEAIKQKVFQPFFTSKPPGEGTGLGLSISYETVVKGHGGSLDLITREGIGSEFIISLPARFINKEAV